MHPVDAYAPPALVLLIVVLVVMVGWERWPHVRWWCHRRIERWRVERDVWLIDGPRRDTD